MRRGWEVVNASESVQENETIIFGRGVAMGIATRFRDVLNILERITAGLALAEKYAGDRNDEQIEGEIELEKLLEELRPKPEQ
jgi:hypothetical protein